MNTKNMVTLFPVSSRVVRARSTEFREIFLGYPHPTTNTISAGFKGGAEKRLPPAEVC